jgi:hypothetical protein
VNKKAYEGIKENVIKEMKIGTDESECMNE